MSPPSSPDPASFHPFRKALVSSIQEHQQRSTEGALLIVDVDRLAFINKARGHDAGDATLVAVGQHLKNMVGRDDILGRLDGDRYGIILQRSDQKTLSTVASKILDFFRHSPLHTTAGDVSVTVSIGGVLYPTHASSFAEVMYSGEQALLSAKNEGRDRFVAYTPPIDQKQIDREDFAVGEIIKEALRTKNLVFAYQPIVDARTGKIAFYECLLRLVKDDGDVLPAAAFIPAVERVGLSGLIDGYVLDLALQDLTTYQDVTLAINVSGYTVLNTAWLDTFLSKISVTPAVAQRLIVELTETATVSDIEKMVLFVRKLHETGVRVAIDDFGVGYTTFQHLRDVPLDFVKIDGSYVKDLDTNPKNQLFVKNLSDLSSRLGMKAVAECVETSGEADLLRREGVDFLQGYYCGRPMVQRPWLKTSPV